MGVMDFFVTKYYAAMVFSDDYKRIGWSWKSSDREKAKAKARDSAGISRNDDYTIYTVENGYIAYAKGVDSSGKIVIDISSSQRSSAAAIENAIEDCKGKGAVRITETRSIHSQNG